jgi:hypothetical protein
VSSDRCTSGRADVDTSCEAHRAESCVYLDPLLLCLCSSKSSSRCPSRGCAPPARSSTRASWPSVRRAAPSPHQSAHQGTTPSRHMPTQPTQVRGPNIYLPELPVLVSCVLCRGSFEHLLLNASADRPLSTSSSQSASSRPSSRGRHSHSSSSGQARRPSSTSSGSGAERAQSGDDQGHRSEPSGRNSRASSSSSRGSTGSKGSG